MTKKKFDEDSRETYVCRICGEIVERDNVAYREVYDDGTLRHCKACGYNIRHNNVNLTNLNYSNYHKLLSSIFNKGVECINDIAKNLDGITLSELIEEIKKMNIKGKKLYVLYKCDYCGKDFKEFPCKVNEGHNNFCSSECYHLYQKENALVGEESPTYNRVKTTCTNCGKEISKIRSHYDFKNKYGDNHNFCSKECYWEYRKKYYVGDKSPCLNRELTEEMINEMRKRSLENSRKSDRFETKPQLLLNSYLDEIGIKFEREKIFDYYAVDNYLCDFNLIIEVMGDYWHGNPNKYNESKYKMNQIQFKTIHTDKSKNTYLFNYYNIKPLYLWEEDILNNKEVCIKLIEKYISCSGILKDYNSFNYYIENDKIKLKQEVITPYQGMPQEKYKHLLKVV